MVAAVEQQHVRQGIGIAGCWHWPPRA
jgi:hypothetical protein